MYYSPYLAKISNKVIFSLGTFSTLVFGHYLDRAIATDGTLLQVACEPNLW